MTRSCSLIALGLVAVLSSSCAEDSSGSPARDGTTPDAATGPPAPRFVEGPTIENNPNPVPLAAVVRLRTDVPTRARIEIGDGRTVAFRQLATSHVLPVLGLQPGTTYSIKVSISNERGVEVEAPAALPFTTVPLPGDFPPITATVVQPDKVEPGVVVFSPARASQPPRYVVGVDEAGKVVWYYEGLQGAVVRPLASGNLLLVAGDDDIWFTDGPIP